VVALGLGPALALPALAEAHAAYLRSEPGAGAVLAQPPTRIDIWFTQDLFRRTGENRIEVRGPDDVVVPAADPIVDDDDRKHLSVELFGEVEPGTYQVAWRSLSSEDGDDDEGWFEFTYDPNAAVTSTPMADQEVSTLPPTNPATPEPTAVATVQPGAGRPTPTPAALSPGGGGCSLGPALAVGLGGLGLARRRRR
jgi:methionine-rich copper-binding protein CopC